LHEGATVPLGYRCAPMDTETASPRLRRAYFECRYGQLHVHNAIPAGGGFDEQTTLICLHGAHATGRMFLSLSAILAKNRSIYSPDIPGFGESDAAPGALSISGYADAIGDFLDSMRFRQVDLLGVEFGAAVAAEIAIARPKVVRRVVMAGSPQGKDWKPDSRLPLVKQPLLAVEPGLLETQAASLAQRLGIFLAG
jgi:pimeloyl-ACP methyl ester carboxylesterase